MPRPGEGRRGGRPRVLLTRARDRVDGLARGCRALGLEPVLLPCLEIEPLDVPFAPPASGTVVFTSAHAVACAARRHPLPWAGTRTLAIGAATRDALVEAGQPPAAPAVPPYTSEALLERLRAPGGPCLDAGVTIVKGVGGRAALADGLAAAGVRTRTLEVYRRHRPAHDAATVDAALSPPPDVLCTTSDEVLDNLLALAGPHAGALLDVPLVVNGTRAAAHARALGFRGDVMAAERAGDAGQLDRLAAWYAARPTARSIDGGSAPTSAGTSGG